MVQKALFSRGIKWRSGSVAPKDTKKKYLFVDSDDVPPLSLEPVVLTHADDEDYFNKHSLPEVSPWELLENTVRFDY